MSNYKIETKCIQSGYEPGNGEPRVLPIYQSTTFKYNSSDQMGRLFALGLGMQMLFEESDEVRPCKGLGLLPGCIRRIETDLKLPQIGWNALDILRPNAMTEGLENGSYVYFVHGQGCNHCFHHEYGAVRHRRVRGGRAGLCAQAGALFCVFAAAAQGRRTAAPPRTALSGPAGGGRDAAAGFVPHLLSGKRGTPRPLLYRRGRFRGGRHPESL